MENRKRTTKQSDEKSKSRTTIIRRGEDQVRRSSSPKKRSIFVNQTHDQAVKSIEPFVATENACPNVASGGVNAVTGSVDDVLVFGTL